MTVIAKLMIALSAMFLTSFASPHLSRDFLAGFEAGIFVRDDKTLFADYSCSEPGKDSDLVLQAKRLVTPMRLVAGLANDERISSTVEAVEAFVLTISDVTSVFTGEYDGGDFCSGLIFGKDGSKMMLQIAQAFIRAPPKEHHPEMKE